MELLKLVPRTAMAPMGEPPPAAWPAARLEPAGRKRWFLASTFIHFLLILLIFLSSFAAPDPPRVALRFPRITELVMPPSTRGGAYPNTPTLQRAAIRPVALKRFSLPPSPRRSSPPPSAVVDQPPAVPAIRPVETPVTIALAVPPPAPLSDPKLTLPVAKPALDAEARRKPGQDAPDFPSTKPAPAKNSGSGTDPSAPALTLAGNGHGAGQRRPGAGPGPGPGPGVGPYDYGRVRPTPAIHPLPDAPELSVASPPTRHSEPGPDGPKPPADGGVHFLGALPRPEYPEELRDRKIDGWARITVLFKAGGTKEIVGEPEASHPAFAAAAVAAVMKIRFTPASQDQAMTMMARFSLARKTVGDLSSIAN